MVMGSYYQQLSGGPAAALQHSAQFKSSKSTLPVLRKIPSHTRIFVGLFHIGKMCALVEHAQLRLRNDRRNVAVAVYAGVSFLPKDTGQTGPADRRNTYPQPAPERWPSPHPRKSARSIGLQKVSHAYGDY